ncbi:MAG: hypothetical protein NO516_04740 [Candidatus Methanomethylicia archaeon]|nr:hypothetical protein [Candidatus Methanomethylicia archaeon]
MEKLRNRIRGIQAFAIAASSMPLVYLFSAPCGLSCAACPISGMCVMAYPVLIAFVLAAKLRSKLKNAFRIFLDALS